MFAAQDEGQLLPGDVAPNYQTMVGGQGITMQTGQISPHAGVFSGGGRQVAPVVAQPEITQHIHVLQDEQQTLLNSIMGQQHKEKDQKRLQELVQQQNELLQQMQALQAAGFQYHQPLPVPAGGQANR